MLTDNLNTGESTTFTYGTNWVRSNKNGHNYTKYFDSWGNVTSSSDPYSSVSYTYYSNGSPKTATSGGNVVSMEYDTAGRRTKMTDPSAGETNYTYDTYGRLITQTDARGYTTTKTYNSRGQLTNSTTGTIVDNYVYGDNSSNNGLLLSATRSSNPVPFSALYTYDNYGRVTNETHMIGQITKSMAYTYNAQGQIATQTYPNQLQITYEYDSNGYLNRMLSGTKQLYKLDEYVGDTYVAILDDDITSSYLYDPYGRLDEAFFTLNNGTDKYYQKYEYGQHTGNITSRILGDINNDEETFTYDALERLTSWTKGNTTQSYEYDPMGSISYKSDLGYMSYLSGNSYAVYEIDNIFDDVEFPQPNVNTMYDELGMVKQLISNNYHTYIFYGPDNNRWRSMNSDNVYYFDNYEEVTTNNVTRTFVYLENGVLAVSDNTNGTQFYYMATDILGSVIGIVDGSGNEVFAATYDPWGKQTVTRNDLGFRRGFTGHEMLPNYDLINMNGRLYDPYLARFLSPDNYIQLPDFSQSFNRYSYCLNNPLKYTDPSGELIGIDDILIIAAMAYIGGIQANISHTMSNGTNPFNPLAWNWNSFGTYLGLAEGGMNGAGMAGLNVFSMNVPGIIPNGTLHAAGNVLLNGITNITEERSFFENWGWSALSGFIEGAIGGYEASMANNKNIWWGNDIGYNRSPWSLINTDKPDEIIKMLTVSGGSELPNDCAQQLFMKLNK